MQCWHGVNGSRPLTAIHRIDDNNLFQNYDDDDNAFMNHPTDDLNWVAQLPFASVIQTNYAPTAEELVRSKVLLSEPQLQLSQLESEVAHVQSVLDDPRTEGKLSSKVIVR